MSAPVRVCGFCERPSIGRCAWRVLKFIPTDYSELREGDLVRRIQEFRARPPARVESIRSDGGSLLIALNIKGRRKEISVKPSSRCRVSAEVRCYASVCELHLREVDPDRVYCRDHWHAWEQAA